MFRSFLSKWIEGRRRKGRVGRVCRAQQPTFQPRLEALEERTLLNAGALDPTFGSGGVALPNSPFSPPLYNTFRSVFAAQPNGGLVEAASDAGNSFEVLRQNPDGSSDATFGTGGAVVVVVPSGVSPSQGGAFEQITVSAVAVQADGKILVGLLNGFGVSAEIVRLNKDGTVDQTFGNEGFVNNTFGSSGWATVSGLAVQADGSIVLAGTVDGQFALARYDPTGNLDASFGNGGAVVTAIGSGDVASSMALQADGKIIVAGSISDASGLNEMALARYNTDGSLDSTFGNGGMVETALGNSSAATDVAIQADGDIVTAGTTIDVPVIAGGFGSGAVLVRYTSNGQLDAAFGDNGHVFTGIKVDDVTVSANEGAGPKVALQADGEILLGTDEIDGSVDGVLFHEEIVVARYDATGAVDSTFGNDGQVATDLGQDAAYLSGLAVQPGGRIVTEGVTFDYGNIALQGGAPNYTPHVTLAGFQGGDAPTQPVTTQPVTTPTGGSGDPSSTPVTSTPPVVIVPSAPSLIIPNNIVLTQALSTVVPPTPAHLIAPSFDGQTAVVNTPSTAADPFGIHLVGGSGPGNVDTTAKWDDFPLLSPDYLMGDAATGLAVLPFTPTEKAGVSITTTMDAVFQQLPFWTQAECAPVGEAEPLIDFAGKGNPIRPPSVKSEAGRWPSLAAGLFLSTGMTAAAIDIHRQRTRLLYSATTE